MTKGASLNEKPCTQCHEVKPLSAFYPRSDQPGSFYSACKDCRNAKLRAQAAAKRVTRSTVTIHPDGYALVSLHGKHGEGKFAKVDLEDIRLVSPYKWLFHGGYARTCVGPINERRNIYMHRLILGIDGVPINEAHGDHKNHDTLDNRRSELRKATPHQNSINSRSAWGSTSRFKGVCWLTRKQRWHAQIRVYGSILRLGSYKDETDAARVYDAVARALFGEFASMNLDPLPTRQHGLGNQLVSIGKTP
jgi:hypothetical protein